MAKATPYSAAPLSPQAVMVSKFITSALAWFSVFYRHLSRRKKLQTRKGHVVDALLVLTCLLDLASISVSAYAMTKEISYLEKHDGQVAPASEEGLAKSFILKLLWTCCILYLFSVMAVKAAYLVFFSELYDKVTTVRKWPLHLAVVVNALSYIVCFAIFMAWCGTDVEENWNPTKPESKARCPSPFTVEVFLTWSCLNIFTDLFILAVPVRVISALNLRRLQLFGLVIVFAISFISILSTVFKLVFILPDLLSDRKDWVVVNKAMMLSHIEIFCAIWALTLPSFQVVLNKLHPFFSSLWSKASSMFGGSVQSHSNSKISDPDSTDDDRDAKQIVHSGKAITVRTTMVSEVCVETGSKQGGGQRICVYPGK